MIFVVRPRHQYCESGIRRVCLKQILETFLNCLVNSFIQFVHLLFWKMCWIFLIEARQICWSTFLRYALYNLDSRAIIWLSVDLNLGRTRKFIPPPLEGRRGVWNPTRSFWYVRVFWNDLAFSGKSLIFLTRWGIFYGWWRCCRPVTSPTMFAILDITKNLKSG